MMRRSRPPLISNMCSDARSLHRMLTREGVDRLIIAKHRLEHERDAQTVAVSKVMSYFPCLSSTRRFRRPSTNFG